MILLVIASTCNNEQYNLVFSIKKDQKFPAANHGWEYLPNEYYPLIVIDMGVKLRYDAILGLKTSNPFT